MSRTGGAVGVDVRLDEFREFLSRLDPNTVAMFDEPRPCTPGIGPLPTHSGPITSGAGPLAHR